jgi:hydroxyethylthiazole kinase-like uncharacterized protein yjeF
VVIIKTEQNSHELVQSMFKPALLPRQADAHKGMFGDIAVIGGDTGMVGAMLLAARAALLTGAGRVYAGALCVQAPSADVVQPELMLRSTRAISELPQLSCIVIGPGLGQSDEAHILLELWLGRDIPMLLDADALNLVARYPKLVSLMRDRQAETIITPHVGEASRLLGTDISAIRKERTASALKLAEKLHAICILKGAGSICAHHDGTWFVNTTGNPGLASAGTGDVLSGIIGGLISQGLTALHAAKLGVYVHGAAADALVGKGIGPVGLTASEVAIEARSIINQLNAMQA